MLTEGFRGSYGTVLGSHGFYIPKKLYTVLQEKGASEVVIVLSDIDCDCGHFRTLRIYPIDQWKEPFFEALPDHVEIEEYIATRTLGSGNRLYLSMSRNLKEKLGMKDGDDLNIAGPVGCMEVWKKGDYEKYFELYLKPSPEETLEETSN